MQEQTTITPALYSSKLPTKSQTYFFDVREAKNGSKYLSITQSRMREGQRIRNTVTVFADQLDAFNQVFAEAQSKTL